jgi:2-isopropylmalate synthase
VGAGWPLGLSTLLKDEDVGGSYVPIQVRRTSELKFHADTAPGVRFLAMDKCLCADAPLYLAVRRVNGVPQHQPEYIQSHVHSVDSLYVFIGDEEGLRGLRATVRVEEEEREIESPMTVLIPKGVPHSYKLVGGSGIYLSILLDGDYNGHTFEAASEVSR